MNHDQYMDAFEARENRKLLETGMDELVDPAFRAACLRRFADLEVVRLEAKKRLMDSGAWYREKGCGCAWH